MAYNCNLSFYFQYELGHVICKTHCGLDSFSVLFGLTRLVGEDHVPVGASGNDHVVDEEEHEL